MVAFGQQLPRSYRGGSGVASAVLHSVPELQPPRGSLVLPIDDDEYLTMGSPRLSLRDILVAMHGKNISATTLRWRLFGTSNQTCQPSTPIWRSNVHRAPLDWPSMAGDRQKHLPLVARGKVAYLWDVDCSLNCSTHACRHERLLPQAVSRLFRANAELTSPSSKGWRDPRPRCPTLSAGSKRCIVRHRHWRTGCASLASNDCIPRLGLTLNHYSFQSLQRTKSKLNRGEARDAGTTTVYGRLVKAAKGAVHGIPPVYEMVRDDSVVALLDQRIARIPTPQLRRCLSVRFGSENGPIATEALAGPQAALGVKRVLQRRYNSFPAPALPKSAAAILLRRLNLCQVGVLQSIFKSTSRNMLDVWALVGEWSTIRRHASALEGVHLRAQADYAVPRELKSFGDLRSGQTKPAFVMWALNVSANYHYVWHIEDDVLWTGPWSSLLHSDSEADILSPIMLADPIWWHWTQPGRCSLRGSECVDHHSPTRQQCPVVTHPPAIFCQLPWVVSRFSVRFLFRLYAEMMFGAKGHHEALTTSICNLMGEGCRFELLCTGGRGNLTLGAADKRSPSEAWTCQRRAPDGESPESLLTAHQLQQLALYHPYKCQKHPYLGNLSLMLASSPPNSTLLRYQAKVKAKVKDGKQGLANAAAFNISSASMADPTLVAAVRGSGPFPFINLGHTNAALFNKSVGANAAGKTLAFWHIPKTGGTYVENVLSQAGINLGMKLFEAVQNKVRLLMPKGPTGWMSPWHVPLPWMLDFIEQWALFYDQDGKKPTMQNWYGAANQAFQDAAEGNTLRWWLDPENVDFFCVVRNPYKKLISEYKWYTSLYVGNRKRGKRVNCSVEALNGFLAKQVPSGNFDNHMTPQVRYVFDSGGRQVCKHVLRQENLDAELAALLIEYNLIDAAEAVTSHAEAMANGNRDQATAINDLKSADCGFDPSVLTEETKQLVLERYREDFEAFGYSDRGESDPAEGDHGKSGSLLIPASPAFRFTRTDELASATAAGGVVPAAALPSFCAASTYAILISGQVQRFVWQDETGPLVAAADPACPPIVDVYIVLQQGEMGRIWRGTAPDTPYKASTTTENLQDWYRTRGARHVWVKHVSEAAIRAFLDEAPFPDETSTWRHSSDRDETGARYRSNLKMFYLRHLAFAAAATSEPSYDGFTYWREDNFFFTPLPEAYIPSAGPKPEVAVDANCGWWSYSDKIYASNPAGAAVLFDLTLDDFITKMKDWAACGAPSAKTPCYSRVERVQWQTELFLTNVMAAAGVTVKKREFHRTDVRYVPGHNGICVPGLYWGCAPDAYLNTGLNVDHGIQCCSGDAQCAVSPEQEQKYGYAAQRDWQPDAAKTLVPYRARSRPRAALPCADGRMDDGQPFLFQSPGQTHNKAFVCLNEQAGSTSWKLALLRAGPHTEFHNLTISPHGAPAERDCGKYNSRDAAVPRFMMVRNPYSRLLSGYMDRCVGTARDVLPTHGIEKVCGSIEDPAATFPAFVKAVINEDLDQLDGHFSLLSRHCHVDAGYDYYLPVEQIVHWYAPFVSVLDLKKTVSTGWNVSTRWWRNDGSECFYHPPGLGCDGVPATPATNAGRHPSTMGLDEFYTPELARAVSEWARRDLKEFGYPAWDGVDGAEYLRRISAPY